MLYSMTGYGKSEGKNQQFKISVEIKSLNSKGLDINLKIPYWLKPVELDIRNVIQEKLQRGKIDLYLNIELTEGTTLKQYNADAVKNHFLQLKQLAQHLNIDENNTYINTMLFREVISTSDAFQNKEDELITETNKQFILETTEQACNKVNTFRKTEGEKLEKDILSQISLLEKTKTQISETEPQRKQRIREKILSALNENIDTSKINMERYEQELIYYFEKLDINEELVRLSSHIEYFKDICKNELNAGRKLLFLSQEIGREINTIGSKANDDNIQKLVIEMKDVLEKTKEQLNNII